MHLFLIVHRPLFLPPPPHTHTFRLHSPASSPASPHPLVASFTGGDESHFFPSPLSIARGAFTCLHDHFGRVGGELGLCVFHKAFDRCNVLAHHLVVHDVGDLVRHNSIAPTTLVDTNHRNTDGPRRIAHRHLDVPRKRRGETRGKWGADVGGEVGGEVWGGGGVKT